MRRTATGRTHGNVGRVASAAVADDQRRLLITMWRECQEMTAELAETRAARLCRQVSRSIRAYAEARGGVSSEADAARSMLMISQRDLRWVQTHRGIVPDQEISRRLRHALRGSGNAVNLQRWSWD